MLPNIKCWYTLGSQLSLLIHVVGALICNQSVSDGYIPIDLRKRHGWPFVQCLVCRTKDMINEVEAIIKYLVFRRIVDNASRLESVMDVVTNISSKLQPKSQRIRWRAVAENGDKEVAQLVTACHMSSFLKALSPLVIVL